MHRDVLHVLEVGREGEPLRRGAPARVAPELPRAELLEAQPPVAHRRGDVDVQEDVELLLRRRHHLGLDLVEQLVVARLRDQRRLEDDLAYIIKGGEIGDFGGGSLEPPRRWLGAQWLGLTEGVPSCPEPPGAP